MQRGVGYRPGGATMRYASAVCGPFLRALVASMPTALGHSRTDCLATARALGSTGALLVVIDAAPLTSTSDDPILQPLRVPCPPLHAMLVVRLLQLPRGDLSIEYRTLEDTLDLAEGRHAHMPLHSSDCILVVHVHVCVHLSS